MNRFINISKIIAVTARHTAKTIPLTQFLKDIKSIDNVMMRMRASPASREEIRSYLQFVYLRNNRVTIPNLAKLLYLIPPRIRINTKQMELLSRNCFFPHQRFFQHIGENCRRLGYTCSTGKKYCY